MPTPIHTYTPTHTTMYTHTHMHTHLYIKVLVVCAPKDIKETLCCPAHTGVCRAAVSVSWMTLVYVNHTGLTQRLKRMEEEPFKNSKVKGVTADSSTWPIMPPFYLHSAC